MLHWVVAQVLEQELLLSMSAEQALAYYAQMEMLTETEQAHDH